MLMRGSIPRRKPDPSRRPEPRPIIEKKPQHMHSDRGQILIPSNGGVKIYDVRFVRAGRIEDPSIQVSGLPDNANVAVSLMDDQSNVLFTARLSNGINGFPDSMVPANTRFSIWAEQKNGENEILIEADVAFVYQEA